MNARPNIKNLSMEKLTDESLEEWLQRPDPTPPENAGEMEAHVRVLVCHQTENENHTPGGVARQKWYHVARSSFDAIEEHLKLPIQTLPAMASMWGAQSSEFIADTNAREREMMCLGKHSTARWKELETCCHPTSPACLYQIPMIDSGNCQISQ